MCTHVCVGVFACVCARRGQRSTSVIFYRLHLGFSGRSLTEPGAFVFQGWLAKQPEGSASPPVLDSHTSATTPGLCVGSGI